MLQPDEELMRYLDGSTLRMLLDCIASKDSKGSPKMQTCIKGDLREGCMAAEGSSLTYRLEGPHWKAEGAQTEPQFGRVMGFPCLCESGSGVVRA
eukprot:5056711-Amphidinium_carterae.1